jgi:hypothetical protein
MERSDGIRENSLKKSSMLLNGSSRAKSVNGSNLVRLLAIINLHVKKERLKSRQSDGLP